MQGTNFSWSCHLWLKHMFVPLTLHIKSIHTQLRYAGPKFFHSHVMADNDHLYPP